MKIIKNPIFWSITVITIAMIISVYFIAKPKNNSPEPDPDPTPKPVVCEGNKIISTCEGAENECMDKCTDTTAWDCHIKKCETLCSVDQIPCNNVCRNKNNVIQNGDTCIFCEEDNRIIYDDEGNPKDCCEKGKVNDGSNNCVITCGNSPCEPNDICFIANLNNTVQENDFKAQFKDKNPEIYSENGQKKGRVCAPKPTCSVTQQRTIPTSINTFQPCTNLINFVKDSEYGFCVPADGTPQTKDDYNRCHAGQTRTGSCPDNCKFVKVLDTPPDEITKYMENIESSNAEEIYKGQWCSKGQQTKYITSNTVSSDNSICSATDCWDLLNKNENIQQIKWTPPTIGKFGYCNSLIKCSNNKPDNYVDSSYCNGKPPPAINVYNLCDEKSGIYNCTNGDIIAKKYEGTCQSGTCIESIKSNNGWCLKRNKSNTEYKQLCKDSLNYCSDPGDIYIKDTIFCPDVCHVTESGKVDTIDIKFLHINYYENPDKIVCYSNKDIQDKYKYNFNSILLSTINQYVCGETKGILIYVINGTNDYLNMYARNDFLKKGYVCNSVSSSIGAREIKLLPYSMDFALYGSDPIGYIKLTVTRSDGFYRKTQFAFDHSSISVDVVRDENGNISPNDGLLKDPFDCRLYSTLVDGGSGHIHVIYIFPSYITKL